ncbi:hypothetical protein PENTCL1PPCAC_23697 [Pristionchus entomophagus]|uniref:F-box domain-containing protein n=1 Tax=Pristionchus entomophagus TaxID=358040 RepID=A0AAV5U572_9BILA|nr:hypothetical protein PENTCL1PPCAC_23697 [Pristionchus entomophagus]
MYGSTSITDMPAEIIDQICEGLTLEETANLQGTAPLTVTPYFPQDAYAPFERLIDAVFFPRFNKMRLTTDDNDKRNVMITFSPRSTHSYLEQSFSIPSNSDQIKPILRSCSKVDSLTISFSDHHEYFKILSAITEEGIELTKLVVNFHTPKECGCGEDKPLCKKIRNRSHRKVTDFVRAHARTLTTLKVSTSEEDSVSVELRPADGASTSTESHVVYSHHSDSAVHQSLIYQVFNAMNYAKPTGPSSVILTVDWRQRLDLALQSAFMVALPVGQRGGVRKMRIGFSSKVSALKHDEIHDCLEAFSHQLSETHRLQELLCDFTKSQIDLCQLEPMFTALSSPLGRLTHRIRFLMDEPVWEQPNLIKQEWAKLPPVY